MHEVTVPNLLWYGNQPRDLTFPDRWKVDVLAPPGFAKAALDEAGYREAFAKPIGSPTLAELARDAHEVAIVFDDMTRPTPVREVLPYVLGPLAEAGVPDANIRFIPALGMHGALTNQEFRKKLGDEVVRRYPIYNHNPYTNCVKVGETASGLPLLLNREFVACDLKIGIGCITPHVHVGFGGGAKLLLPGIAGAESIVAWHHDVIMRAPESTGLGNFEGNVMYAEVADAAKLSGMQVKVDALINDRGEITDLFVGDPLQAHAAGVAAAKEHYGTPPSPGNDVVVVNAYGKYSEMGICMAMGFGAVDFTGGTIALLVDAPEGQVCHYLMRSAGKGFGGDCYIERSAPPATIRTIVQSAYPDRTMTDLFASADSVEYTENWEQTLALIEAQYPGEARVAVIPDGTMQYFF